MSDSETLEALATIRVPTRFLAALAHHCHLCANAVTVSFRSHTYLQKPNYAAIIYTDPLTCKVATSQMPALPPQRGGTERRHTSQPHRTAVKTS